KIDWTVCDAEKLPFKTSSFDVYTIAFGLRNCIDKEKVLSEAFRVLKSGGLFYCLEFSKVDNKFLNKLYKYYSFKIIPLLGYMIAGQIEPYQYLVESIEKFYSKNELSDRMEEVGFKDINVDQLNAGIVAIHCGKKI
ncbi:MAG: 2-hexaprenyl-6-methoxy-1,4-benzoquinone methyltransferase, partial [Paramarteilia canceri]